MPRLHVRAPLLLLLLVALAVPAFAAEETATEPTTTAQQAEALVKQGKIEEGRDAFIELAKANPDDQKLMHRAMLLSRVLKLQNHVANNEPSPVWERAVCSLHAFFHQEGLGEMALAQDKAAHAASDSITTACLVGESLLELGQNDQAVAFFDGLREGQKTDQVTLLECIGLARVGRQDEARDNVELLGWPETKDAGMLFDMARLQALLGDTETSLATLTSSFQNCPPPSLSMLKRIAKTSPDLATARSHEGFGKVMETASTMKTGCGCSGGCGGGGSSCEGCPKRGDCADKGCDSKDCEGKDCDGKDGHAHGDHEHGDEDCCGHCK